MGEAAGVEAAAAEAAEAALLVAGLLLRMVENRRHSQIYLSSLFSFFFYSDCTMRQ